MVNWLGCSSRNGRKVSSSRDICAIFLFVCNVTTNVYIENSLRSFGTRNIYIYIFICVCVSLHKIIMGLSDEYELNQLATILDQDF